MTTTDLTGLTRADLLALVVRLGAELDVARTQLEQARAARAAGAPYADRHWYTETTHRERQLGREIQRVYVRIGQLRSEEGAVRQAPRKKDFYRSFFDRVREALPRAQFRGLCDAADEYVELTK